MNREQFDMMVQQMHQKGLTDEMILEVLHETFAQHKCSFEDFEVMVHWLEYSLTDDFYRDHEINKKGDK